jgi:DNA ligase-1
MPYFLFILLFLSLTSFSHAEKSIPPLTLAKIYKGKIDLTQYWISEKLDGVRAYWNGQQFISRRGNPYPAPAWFTKDFPKLALDGELWLGRDQFQPLISIVRKKQAIDSEWHKVRYFAFDIPLTNKPFTQRLNELKQLVSLTNSPYLKLVKQYRISDETALQQELDRIVAIKGEGLMLHRADALYHAGRNSDLLKLKPYFDAEAKVIAHIAGKGKYTGMMGSLLVETAKGLQFKIGSGFTDQQRSNPPEIGKTITFTYHGKTQKGIPKFASFLRIRDNIFNFIDDK